MLGATPWSKQLANAMEKPPRHGGAFCRPLTLDPQLLAYPVRAHRGIENRRHWALDVVFHDDLMRLRTENGPGNMATIKHMAMNLIREANGKESLSRSPCGAFVGKTIPRMVL